MIRIRQAAVALLLTAASASTAGPAPAPNDRTKEIDRLLAERFDLENSLAEERESVSRLEVEFGRWRQKAWRLLGEEDAWAARRKAALLALAAIQGLTAGGRVEVGGPEAERLAGRLAGARRSVRITGEKVGEVEESLREGQQAALALADGMADARARMKSLRKRLARLLTRLSELSDATREGAETAVGPPFPTACGVADERLLPCPVPDGRIETKGTRGVEISRGGPLPVFSIAAGEVVWVGPLAGYGLTVIVRHDGFWHTVAAALGESPAVAGERVPAGAYLGYAPASVYFEVRLDGMPENPRYIIDCENR